MCRQLNKSSESIPRETLLVPASIALLTNRVHALKHPAAFTQLLSDAEEACQVQPPSVLDKAHIPPSGDKRDYFSLSIYFWPDPTKPDGLPYIARDGLVNPECEQYDRSRFEQMVSCVESLALAYAASGNESYAERAAAFLWTWFLDPQTGMHPNMLCAQYIPGENVMLPWKEYPARYVPGTGGRKGIFVSFGGLIEDHLLIPLTDCVRLLRGSVHWTEAHDDGMAEWYRAYTSWLQTHQHGLDEAGCRNNHGSWYWADIVCFLEFAGQKEEARRIIEDVLPGRLEMQIAPDGSQPEELVRAISKRYTAFTLASFTNIAIVGDRCGCDAWTISTGDGRSSVKSAIDWFIPYLTGEKAWTWKQVKPFSDFSTIGMLAACAARFPDDHYKSALRHLATSFPEKDRARLLYPIA